ncbi:hypothetical protein [Nocardia sp. NPDC059239]|uniref:hypothetical protein n=1 Tax=unclassified Nocardia TaxID=2637762 RepID=UPI00368E98F5
MTSVAAGYLERYGRGSRNTAKVKARKSGIRCGSGEISPRSINRRVRSAMASTIAARAARSAALPDRPDVDRNARFGATKDHSSCRWAAYAHRCIGGSAFAIRVDLCPGPGSLSGAAVRTLAGPENWILTGYFGRYSAEGLLYG